VARHLTAIAGTIGALAIAASAKVTLILSLPGQNPSIPAWGGPPAPGTAKVSIYPNCTGGRVVADVVRPAKGHTEGLEPNVTEGLVKLMMSAPGGKIAQLK